MTTVDPVPLPWWQRWPVAVLVSALLAVAVVGSASGIGADDGTRRIDAMGVALGVAAAIALLTAWLNPWLMITGVSALLATYWGMRYTGGPAMLAAPLAVLRFGLLRPRNELYAATFGVIGVIGVGLLISGRPLVLTEIGALTSLSMAAAFAADAIRQRDRRRAAEAEVRRRQQEQGVAEQQLSLARELHDGIAHSLTAIAVQAAVVERSVTADPDGAAQAAGAIAGTSRAALADLNSILRSLRQPGDAPHTVARGLADIPALVAQSERSGHQVRLVLPDSEAGQPAERWQVVYRVVQEALTNATRYAPGSTIAVTVRTKPCLTVRVRDDGAAHEASTAAGSGYGLVGMAERVGATGGRLRAGPRAARGFEVEATWE